MWTAYSSPSSFINSNSLLSRPTGFLIRRKASPKAALLPCELKNKTEQKTKQNIKLQPSHFFCTEVSILVYLPKVRSSGLHVSLCVCCHVFFSSRGGVCVCFFLQSCQASTHRHHSLYKDLSAPWHRLCLRPHHLGVTHVHFTTQLQRVLKPRGWVWVHQSWLILNALNVALVF